MNPEQGSTGEQKRQVREALQDAGLSDEAVNKFDELLLCACIQGRLIHQPDVLVELILHTSGYNLLMDGARPKGLALALAKAYRLYDSSSEYMKKLLTPELTTLPDFGMLPLFVATRTRLRLPVMNIDYDRACLLCPNAPEVLIPLCEVPGAEMLACRVSGVLNGRMCEVRDEAMLHHDVDALFERMFYLATEAGRLLYVSLRNSGDRVLDTAGERLLPDYMLWVERALLFKGEEERSVWHLPAAEDKLLSKLASPWNSELYGPCPYMLGYVVGGSRLKIVAIKSGQRLDLISVDMDTMQGKLDALVAVVNVLRLLCAMAKQQPSAIRWPVGNCYTDQDDKRAILSQVINMGDYVHKELRQFDARYKQYAPPGRSALQFLTSVYEAIDGAEYLVQAKAPPSLQGSTYKVDLQPVGLSYKYTEPQDVEEAKLAIRGVLLGLKELHVHGIVHRDVQWSNVILVTEGGVRSVKLIDLETAGEAGASCTASPPYPLPHWLYGGGRCVLEKDGTYTARSDLRMVGKELMRELSIDLGDDGIDLRKKLQDGVYHDADSALAHPWFHTAKGKPIQKPGRSTRQKRPGGMTRLLRQRRAL